MNRIDEQDIVISYRDAKYPKMQERILADLYDCDVEDIREVLKRNGVYNPNARTKGHPNNRGRTKGSHFTKKKRGLKYHFENEAVPSAR